MPMQDIAVIGITGRIGKRVAGELLARGARVRGGNRRPERVRPVLEPLGLTLPTAQVDTGNYESVARFVSGADAVVLATAPTREHPEEYPGHSANVIRACKQEGVRRLVALSNFMALKGPDGRPMLEVEPPHPAFERVERVYAQERDLFFAETELDWLLVAPPAEVIPYGEVTGRYRVGTDTLLVTDPEDPNFKRTSRLTMEDLASFAAQETWEPVRHRQLVTLAYGEGSL